MNKEQTFRELAALHNAAALKAAQCAFALECKRTVSSPEMKQQFTNLFNNELAAYAGLMMLIEQVNGLDQQIENLLNGKA